MRREIGNRMFPQYYELRKGVADRLAKSSQLPHGLRKFVGVMLFLVVSSLVVSGGAFMIAAFMHVIVTKLDMPPAVPFPSYAVAQTTVANQGASVYQSGRQNQAFTSSGTAAATKPPAVATVSEGQPVVTGAAEASVSGGQLGGSLSGSGPSAISGAGGSTGSGSAAGAVVVPRPTLQHTLDRVIDQNRNPANAYIQSDAVDLGLLLQRQVHQWLMNVFAAATRAPSAPSVEQVGVPLTGGQ